MVEDHIESEKGNPLPTHGLLFLTSSKGSFIHTMAFVTPVMEHWLEREMAGTRNSSMGSPWRIDRTTHRTMSERSYHGATSRSPPHEGLIGRHIAPWANALTTELHLAPHPMKDWSDDTSHHERTLLPRSYISLPTPWRIDRTTHRTMSERSYHGATSRSPPHEGLIRRPIAPWANALTTELHLAPHPMKDWSDDTSHHERTLLPRSYISLPTPWRIDRTTHRTMSERSYHGATSRSPPHEGLIGRHIAPWANALTTELHLAPHPMKDWSDDTSHHERTLLPRSYISLPTPWRIDRTTHRTMSERSYHGATSRSPPHEGLIGRHIAPWANALTTELHLAPHPMKDWSDDTSHHERTLLPRSYISLPTPWRIDPTTHRTMSERSYHGATSRSPPHEGLIGRPIAPWANALTTELHLAPHPMKDWSDDTSHHERTLLPRSYISLPTPWRIDRTTHRTMSERSYHGATSRSPPHEGLIGRHIAPWANALTTELHLAPHPMKDWSDDTSHHERTLLPRSYISLPTPWRIDRTTHRTMSERSYHGATSRSPPHEGLIGRHIAPWANALTTELHLAPHPMKDWSDDTSHHERTLLPRSYISLPTPWRIDRTTHRTMSERSYHGATSRSPPHEGLIGRHIAPWANALTTELHLAPHPMKDWSDDTSHHERTLLPRSYISLPTPWRIDRTTHRTMSERSYHGATSRSPPHEGLIGRHIAPWANALTTELHLAPHPMKDWSDDTSHHERTLLPRSYISLPTPWRIDPTTHRTMSERSYHGATSRSPPHEGLIGRPIAPWANALTTELHLAPHPMKDWSDDTSHHERTLLPRSYISLPTPWRIDRTTHRTMSERSYHGATSRSPPHEGLIGRHIAPWANALTTELHLAPHPMKDWSDDTSHHERTLLPRSYISLPTPWRIDRTTHRTMSERSYHGATSRSPPHEGLIGQPIAPWANALTTELHLAPHPMKDWSDDTSHHERTLLPRSYISLPTPWRIDRTTHRTMSERSYHGATSRSPPHEGLIGRHIAPWANALTTELHLAPHPMKDWSDDTSHHERTLLPRSYISLPTPWRIDRTTHRTMSERSYHGATSRSPPHEGLIGRHIAPWANALTTELHLAPHPMKDRSDDTSHHERTLLPRSYISLPTPWRIDRTTHRTMSERSYHGATSRSPPHEGLIGQPIAPWANALTTELHLAPHPMKDRSDDPSHHERTLLPRSYISLPTPWRIDRTTHRTMSERSYHGATSRSPPHEGLIGRHIAPWANALTTELHLAPHPMKDWSDDTSHHERTLLPRSYISLPTPWRIDRTTHRTMSERSYHGATSRSPPHEGSIRRHIAPWANALTTELHLAPHPMKDWSDDPSHHERTLLPRSYISLPTPWRIDRTTHRTMSERSYHGATSRSPPHEGLIGRHIAPWANALTTELHLAPHPMKDWSDDTSHHERTLLPRSYISLPTPWRIDRTTHRTMSERSYHGATSRSPPHEGSIRRPIAPWANALTTELHLAPHPMKDWSDDTSHHERTLLPRSYISLPTPWRIDRTTHRTMSERSYHGATSRSPPHEGLIGRHIAPWANALTTELHLAPHPMKDWSDDTSHHERTLLPRSYISLPTPWRIDRTTHRTMSERSYHGATSRSPPHEGLIGRHIAPWANALTTELHLAPHPMKDWSDDTSHHERTLLPRSYISLPTPWRIDRTTHRTMSERSYHGATSRSPPHEGLIGRHIAPWANALTTELHLAPHPMKDWSDDTSHHERTLLPRSYISLPTPWRIDRTTHRTMSERSYHGATSRSPPHEGLIGRHIAPWANALTTELHLAPHPMKDWSDDTSHHERTLLPRSYISLPTPWRIDRTTHRTMSERSYHGATSRSPPHEGLIGRHIAPWANALTTELHLAPHPMKDWSDDTSHHERTLLPRSYISLPTPWRIDRTTHRTMSEHSYHGATSRSFIYGVRQMVKDCSDSKRKSTGAATWATLFN